MYSKSPKSRGKRVKRQKKYLKKVEERKEHCVEGERQRKSV